MSWATRDFLLFPSLAKTNKQTSNELHSPDTLSQQMGKCKAARLSFTQGHTASVGGAGAQIWVHLSLKLVGFFFFPSIILSGGDFWLSQG